MTLGQFVEGVLDPWDQSWRGINPCPLRSSTPPHCGGVDDRRGHGFVPVAQRWECGLEQVRGGALVYIAQVFPKRCGHLGGKSLISQDQMCEKVKRAVQAAKDHSNGDFVICARTDARGVVDMAEAVARAKA